MIRSRPRQVIGEGSWLHFLSRNHCFTSEAFELGLIEHDPNWICWSIEFEHSVRRKGGLVRNRNPVVSTGSGSLDGGTLDTVHPLSVSRAR